MSREPRKFSHTRVLDAYHDGAQDAIERKPPRPPKNGDARKAYINGYNDHARKG